MAKIWILPDPKLRQAEILKVWSGNLRCKEELHFNLNLTRSMQNIIFHGIAVIFISKFLPICSIDVKYRVALLLPSQFYVLSSEFS